MKSITLCRGLLSIAAVSTALLNLVFGDASAIAHSVPEGTPLRNAWIIASAVVLLAAGLGLWLPKLSSASALVIGGFLAIWALTCIPQIFAAPLTFGGWYGFCEAVSSTVGAWLVYLMLGGLRLASNSSGSFDRSIRVACILFGLTCVFYGASHFGYADYTAAMVPGWLPAPLVLAYATGAAHAAAGIGIILNVLPRLAAILEAAMMSLFGLLVWVPSFFVHPTPDWATPASSQWLELVVNILLAAAAWSVAAALSGSRTQSRS